MGATKKSQKAWIGLAITVGAFLALGACVRLLGLLHPFSIPTGAMTPAISPGDHVMMEGFSFLGRKPRRGDILVFKTDGIPMLPRNQIYTSRLVGLPGERIRFADGKLYVGDKAVSLTNSMGEIHYLPVPTIAGSSSGDEPVTVPAGHYFVVGDNSVNSYDSRSWGCLPAKDVLGRMAFCYSPPAHMGVVK
jgi:signal peptidase I